MKKFKILFLLVIIFFVTGCSIDYKLDITKTKFNESTTINMGSSEFATFTSDTNNQYFSMYYDDKNDNASEGTKKPISGVSYYTYNENSSNNAVKFSGSYSYNNFTRSTAVSRGFNNIKLFNENNELHIKTSEGFTFPYSAITSVKIVVTSPYTVMNSNADSTSGDSLIWNITKNNASKKSIIIDYSTKNSTSTNNNTNAPTEDNNTVITKKSSIDPITIILIASLLLILVLIVLVILKQKSKNNNQI